MFDVLAFVYENYWSGEACPERDHLERKLTAVGFEAEEIAEALAWLGGLSLVARGTQVAANPDMAGRSAITITKTASKPAEPVTDLVRPSAGSMRIYSTAEQDHLGAECLGFVSFLESSEVLSAALREIVLDRAMAAPGCPLALDDLKIIVLMVFWSFGEEPDALILDELCDDASDRVGH